MEEGFADDIPDHVRRKIEGILCLNMSKEDKRANKRKDKNFLQKLVKMNDDEAVEHLQERCECTVKEGQDILQALRKMGLAHGGKKKKTVFFFFFFFFIFRTCALSLSFQ
jgi:hypothetical protein